MPIRWVKGERRKANPSEKTIFQLFSFFCRKNKVSFQRKSETAAPWPACLLGFVDYEYDRTASTTAVSRKLWGIATGARSSFSARFFHSVKVFMFLLRNRVVFEISGRELSENVLFNLAPGTSHPSRCRERRKRNDKKLNTTNFNFVLVAVVRVYVQRGRSAVRGESCCARALRLLTS